MKWWITIGVIAILAITAYIVLNTTIANKLVIKVLFSNKRYAKNIEVKTYVLTQEQVSDLFKYPNRKPIQLTVDELDKATSETKKRYFVARVKNLGNRHAWGTLSCKVRCIRDPLKIPVISIREHFCDHIICITGFIISSKKDSPYPDMSYEWSELYTK